MKKILFLILAFIMIVNACSKIAYVNPDISVDQPATLGDKPSDIDYAK